MNATKNQNEAQQAFHAKLHEALISAKLLVEHLEGMSGDQDVHWGHVGDMGRLNELLDEALRVAGDNQ